MPIRIDSIELLQEYLRGVLDRAGHHAGNVNGIALSLLGAVIWKSDGNIEVKEYEGDTKNMIWFWVNGNKYLMRYEHRTGQIELHDRNINGTVLHRFDNTTPYADLINAFNSL
jgi:hypothetical protein